MARRAWLVSVLLVSVAVAGCTGESASGPGGATTPTAAAPDGTASPATLLPAPPSQVPALLTQQQVDGAVGKLDGLVQDAMTRTGVPGIAVSVVYRDQVVYAKGFGVREVGKPDPIDPDTVFQLASVSKPLASTIVAGVVGKKVVGWNDTARSHSPNFSLKDPYVTQNATIADLLSHRSGLYTGAGDLLEDLGFDQNYILTHLDQQPLDVFRSSYNYSNFGYTSGAMAAADAMKMPWEDLAQQTLFAPLGMTSTSYRHDDYLNRPNKALIHVPVGDKTWAARYVRDADAEAPAGGASSSVRDLAQWVRLHLGNGSYAGNPVIDPAALAGTYVPHSVNGPPATADARARFYGLGWNVSYDDRGRLSLGHSGAFNLGAATSVMMLPTEQLGIVVLTNGRPQGTPEAIGAAFFDVANHGQPTVDWLTFVGKQFALLDESELPDVDYSKPPAQVTPARDLNAYVGTYANSYYGPLTVARNNANLTMTMGPADKPTTFALTHYQGDTFSFPTIGENGNGLAGAIFTLDPAGTASTVKLDFYDQRGLGTFSRS